MNKSLVKFVPFYGVVEGKNVVFDGEELPGFSCWTLGKGFFSGVVLDLQLNWFSKECLFWFWSRSRGSFGFVKVNAYGSVEAFECEELSLNVSAFLCFPSTVDLSKVVALEDLPFSPLFNKDCHPFLEPAVFEKHYGVKAPVFLTESFLRETIVGTLFFFTGGTFGSRVFSEVFYECDLTQRKRYSAGFGQPVDETG